MKVLVVGSGGREHALAWKLSQSTEVSKLFVAPGNDGMIETANLHCVAIAANNYDEILAFCRSEKIDFIVVGPDQALADGLINLLQDNGFLAFGPSKEAAQLESSKAFAKSIMQKAAIPTAQYEVFTDFAKAESFISDCSWQGFAIKADGLALGKGVVLCHTKPEAIDCAKRFLLAAEMGEAGKKIVVEEFLTGREVSAFYLCDGKKATALGFACDYKQIRDGGQGPNTGGMGAYSPVDWLTDNQISEIKNSIVQPCLEAMTDNPFKGILFVGLMITSTGPKVIEFNARFGDPETQAILPIIDEDLLPWLMAAARGELAKCNQTIKMRSDTAVHIVKAAYGYPGTEGVAVRKGDLISVDQNTTSSEGSYLFYAGVKKQADQLITNGGRVLGLTALAATREQAREKAYQAIKAIQFKDAQMRSDIGT